MAYIARRFGSLSDGNAQRKLEPDFFESRRQKRRLSAIYNGSCRRFMLYRRSFTGLLPPPTIRQELKFFHFSDRGPLGPDVVILAADRLQDCQAAVDEK